MRDGIEALLGRRNGAMAPDEVADGMGMALGDAEAALDELVRSGRAVRTKKGRYALPASVGLVGARALVLRSGALAARPLDGGRDLLIAEGGPLRPMLDDVLLVSPLPHRGDGMGRCALHAIVRRARDAFTARIEPGPSAAPADPRLGAHPIELVQGSADARAGDLVRLRVVRYPEGDRPLRAAVARTLGRADDIAAQLRGIAADRGLPDAFPADALAQAAALPRAVPDEDVRGRRDLRDLALFTIDGDDAQDFDDAVSIEPIDGGHVVGVHIADVSHYVRRGAPIDREALNRGTSAYLPGLTLPMLPEALSNRLCSLMPGEDRLAMSLMMTVRGGIVEDHRLFPSAIRSRARLTYARVNALLRGDGGADVPEALHGPLREMARVAGALRARRRARGSIDFDMPEPAFTLDARGRPTDLRARERGEAERLIEDFMLAANETVAALARLAELPFLYRVHGRPDAERARGLAAFLSGLGIRAQLGREPTPGRYQKVLAEAERRGLLGPIQQVMLRSLRRAEYAATPDGHFGLAARDYCHFTSPIRRYPDLEAHRMLKALLAGGAGARDEARMPGLAAHLSACEQRAALAERDADDLLKAHYMADRVGESFDGVVTGVAAFGAYVTLGNTVEGLVPIRTIDGDWTHDEARYALVAPGRPAIRLGDAVRVRLERADTALARIDFVLTD